MTVAADAVLQLTAEAAAIDAKLTSGLTQVRENNREMRFDLNALRARRAEITTQLGILTQAAPTVRRILTYTPSKGL